ncbi:ancient ubiquitous protein 1 isoform X1 [Diaphorina citri]|uniref:Ancient ubiquitous protein 1 isoform X1 n=1 Tax=Diaphorina citri TaxID=121845 RepID=A0A1S3CZI8_DIACI|nr:ancient ubiquitous protein 1 isoform X1 [Diaphorina citri]
MKTSSFQHMYLVASVLPRMTALRRFVMEGMMLVLGFRIKKDTSKAEQSKEAKVFISNHISKFDFIPFHVSLSCNTPNTSSFSFPFWAGGGECLGLINLGRNTRFSRSTFLSKLKSFLCRTEAPIVLFPEEETTNGKKGLLKFSSWPVSACNCVQPVILSAHRPITSISLSPIPSSWYSDFFWSLFTPCTVYTIKFLPVMKRAQNETDEDLMSRIEACIACEGRLSPTLCTPSEKYELEKRLVRALATQNSGARRYDSRMYAEAQRIREIFPNIPLNAIVRELGRSHGNAELTISRLIADSSFQNLSFNSSSSFNQSPSPSSPSTPQFNASPHNRMSAFAEKKAQFIAEARRRYIEKHGLNVPS